jgi:hypothetical protein
MSIEAMKQALDVLEQINQLSIGENAIALPGEIDGAMDNLRAAIEQAAEPVAWVYDFMSDNRDEVIRDWMTQDYADITRENGFNVRPLYAAPRQEYYDQTSLELCGECGWRAMIPGDGCLVCARQNAKPVWIPRVHLEAAQREPSMCRVEPTKRLPDFVPLYAAPREWVELTDDEARALVNRATFGDRTNWQALVYMVDARLKEKNHG